MVPLAHDGELVGSAGHPAEGLDQQVGPLLPAPAVRLERVASWFQAEPLPGLCGPGTTPLGMYCALRPSASGVVLLQVASDGRQDGRAPARSSSGRIRQHGLGGRSPLGALVVQAVHGQDALGGPRASGATSPFDAA